MLMSVYVVSVCLPLSVCPCLSAPACLPLSVCLFVYCLSAGLLVLHVAAQKMGHLGGSVPDVTWTDLCLTRRQRQDNEKFLHFEIESTSEEGTNCFDVTTAFD